MEFRKTFEELADEIGLSAIFTGTDADETIQNIFLEWFFDCKLCSDNDTTFLRYFRRRFNNLYPMYLDQVRVLSVKGNFDPYVTEYYQDLLNKTGTETSEGTRSTTESNESETTATKGSGVTTVRTPDITVTNADTNTSNTEQDTTHGGSDTVRRTGTDTTANTENTSTTSDSKSDAFGIAYPESNLGAIPADLTAARSIDYANSESLTMGTSTTTGTGSSSSTVTYNTTDTNSYGATVNVQGEQTDTSNREQHETGTERTVTTNNGSDVNSVEGSKTGSETSAGTKNLTDEVKQEHKGRNESIADIIPRAVQAITSTNELKWFRDSMLVCFDCTEY